MFTKTVTVGSAVGLHARPAAQVADAAGEYDEDITLTTADGEADAASIIEIMGLGAMQGAEVTVTSENEAAVEEITALIESDLDA